MKLKSFALKIGITLLITLGIAQTVHAQLFTDVNTMHPYFHAISYLKENGIVSGYPDGSFQPRNEVNRAEALKILTLGKEIIADETASGDAQEIFEIRAQAATLDADLGFDLSDVPDDSWYHKYVVQAFSDGIIQGYNDRTFRPGKTVNLAEALKMLLEINNVELPSEVTSDPYKDAYASEWYAPYFRWAKDNYVLIADMNLKVYPDQNITRQELANLIFRFYSLDNGKTFGRASYYADYFHGRTTASGTTFDQEAFTAAHLTLPFGTLVKVVNIENDKSVIVEITDRGPYDQRFVIDLSKGAFESISPLSRGVIQVYYEIIHTP